MSILIDSLRAKFHRKKGQKALQRGKIKKAYNAFRKALLLDNSPENQFNLALVLLSLDNYEEAESILRSIYEHNPQYSFNTFTLAECLMMQRKWDEAIPLFRKLLREEPLNKLYNRYLDLATDVIAREKYVRAQELMKKANSLIDRKKISEALELLLEAVDYDPNNPILNNNVSSLYFKLKDYQKAYSYAERALNFDHENPQIQRNMVQIKRKLRRK